MTRLHRFSEFIMHGPFMEEFGLGSKEAHMICMEFPRMLEHLLEGSLEKKKVVHKRTRLPIPKQ